MPPPLWILPAPFLPLEPRDEERFADEPLAVEPFADVRFRGSRGACVELGCGLVPPPDADLRAAPFAPDELFLAAPDFAAPDLEELVLDALDFAELPFDVEFRPPLVARLAMPYTVSVRDLSRHTSHGSARIRQRGNKSPVGTASDPSVHTGQPTALCTKGKGSKGQGAQKTRGKGHAAATRHAAGRDGSAQEFTGSTFGTIMGRRR